MSVSPESPQHALAIHDKGLSSAVGLMMRSLPYALARFGILLAASIVGILWMVVTIGGSAWLGAHIAGAFGLVWFIGCIAVAGWIWVMLLRYALHLLSCGHVAVLTELIVHGTISNGQESMLAYGKRIVVERFGEVNALFAMNLLVRGVLNSFHSTVDWIADALPIPGLESLANLATGILRAATRYMDKVIFSYNLAYSSTNPWEGARDGVVYYCQNAKPILKTSIWIVVLELVLSVLLWLVLLVPAAAITLLLPHSVREMGGLVTVIIAILFALTARAAFVKPLFLIMIMTRFHTLIEHQPINTAWVAELDQLSGKFRDLGQKAQNFAGRPASGSAVPDGYPAV
jgi:hypothetical protein